ncbi:DUF1080 domain-containing protein [candidate division KSB1 bacterium]
MVRHIKVTFILLYCILFMATAFLACSSSKTASSGSGIETIIAGIPAENTQEEHRILAEIINSGPEGIKALCSLLVPPGTGDDTKERFALTGLAHYVMRPGAENERLLYAETLVDALDMVTDNEVKAFLILRLQHAGKEEVVAPLGKFLTDERLCEPAALSLLSIRTKSAEAEFLKALPNTTDRNRVTIINALGNLRSKAAGYELMKYLSTDDNETRMAILYALANIGPFSPEAILSEAVQSPSSLDRAKSASFYLTYAKRLAEAGLTTQSADMCRNLIKTKTLSDENNIRIAALSLLVDTIGESALWDLLTMVESPDKDVRIAALELTHKIPGANTTIELFNKLNTADAERQAELQDILSKRDRRYWIPALEAAANNWPDDEGFVALFNGKDLSGWKGLVGNPVSRSKMSAQELADAQAKADEVMRAHWRIEDGSLVFDGSSEGSHLCTIREYGDFEMKVDWKIEPGGDSGIYLRGTPQVQIWDITQNPEGSGGLYNNQNNPRNPLEIADRPAGEWNTFLIRMVDDKVTVYLNNVLVVDNTVMENYWDRDLPIFPREQLELQSHGSKLYFKNIRIKDLDAAPVIAEAAEPELEEGFELLFNGNDLTGWIGDKTGYVAEDGKIVVHPERGGGSGNLYTEQEYSDFILRFEFRLTPGANNGLGIRAPLEGDAAYVGMELQILDNTADIYKDLQPYQYHGSIYGVAPAKRGYLKTVGSWNSEEVIVRGSRVTVYLNDVIIVDADIDEASKDGTIDGRNHPGLKREKGHIGFLGHGSTVEFRNIRVKVLK